jgi:hypothetical protein
MILPELQMLQNPSDDLFLFYERNDPHGTRAFGTEQRIHFVNLLYQTCPGAAGGPG